MATATATRGGQEATATAVIHHRAEPCLLLPPATRLYSTCVMIMISNYDE